MDDKVREAFERDYVKHDLGKDSYGDYNHQPTEDAYLDYCAGYQAATKAAEARYTPVVERLERALEFYSGPELYQGERDEDGYTEEMLADMSEQPLRGSGLWSGATAREALADAARVMRGES